MAEHVISNKIAEDIEAWSQNHNEPWISFEFFPPKTDNGVVALKKVLQTLCEYDPLFVDFTWGAGGSTSDLTFDLCKMAKETFGANPNMHLTCTNMDREHIDTALAKCKGAGITNILALRGDPPLGQERWTAADQSLCCATDLVNYIRGKYGDYFSIGVAGYPEGHPTAMTTIDARDVASLSDTERNRCCYDSIVEGEAAIEKQVVHVCRDAAFSSELSYLKTKIVAGARFIVTQMFFDTDVYASFVQACRASDITVPIVPGIMCVSNYGGFQRMVKFCKSRVPRDVLEKVEALREDAEGMKAYGIELAVTMCRRLKELGAPGLHFYCLNSSSVVVAVIEQLGYRKQRTIASDEEKEAQVATA